MKLHKQFLTQSILVRIGIAMGLIAVLALASILSATLFTERSEGKAGAINLAGSLRMQSWVIASTVASAQRPGANRLQEVSAGVAEFESRLNHPVLLAGLASPEGATLREAHQQVRQVWDQSIRPQALAASSPEQAAAFVHAVRPFVAHIETLVGRLEQDLEERIRTLRFYQGIALFLIMFVIFSAMYLMHTQVVVPLADLLACSRAVQRGDFGVRASGTGSDELGQLGEAFNYMVEDLSRMYANLEARVAEKTEALEQTNRSLELLYNTTRTLSERTVTNETLGAVLREVERVIGVQASVICAHEAAQSGGFPLAATALGPDGRPALCQATRCEDCIGTPAGPGPDRPLPSGGRLLSVPLVEAGRTYGVMPLALAPGHALAPWQVKLAEAVGRHIGAALATSRRAEERHRLALFEERSVIARELHDSLAQSLSYLKIQVTRLQALLGREAAREEVDGIVEELKGGLSNAYRQLRELLTTFRLRIEGRGLGTALEDTVREFSQRTGLSIGLDNRLSGIELASNEEIHVLQVIREALSNIEHHAQARRAEVSLGLDAARQVRVTIDDDGRGITDQAPPAHHYGLAIMRDRAASLRGALKVGRRSEGGTRVELRFSPATPFRDPASGQAAPA